MVQTTNPGVCMQVAKDLIKYYIDWYEWYWSHRDDTTIERYKKEFHDENPMPVYSRPTYQPRYFGIAKRLIDTYGINRAAQMVAVSFLLDNPPQDFVIFGSAKFTAMLDSMVEEEFVSCLVINPTLAEKVCK
jgi:hypothetical protein